MDYSATLNDGPSLSAFLAQLAGKTVASATVDDDCMDSWISLAFTDGTRARIRYDWIYEAEFITTDKR